MYSSHTSEHPSESHVNNRYVCKNFSRKKKNLKNEIIDTIKQFTCIVNNNQTSVEFIIEGAFSKQTCRQISIGMPSIWITRSHNNVMQN